MKLEGTKYVYTYPADGFPVESQHPRDRVQPDTLMTLYYECNKLSLVHLQLAEFHWENLQNIRNLFLSIR